MNRTLRFTLQSALGAAVFAGAILATVAESRAQLGKDWCEGVTIRFFTGGAAGDAFGSIVQAGAVQAGIDTGANVELLFSGWDPEVMIQQLREAVAVKPDGIAMMGHPGPAAIAPLAEEAAAQGIPMMYQNVDVPEVRASFGGGYIGVMDLKGQGVALAREALRRFDLGEGDKAFVFVPVGQETRAIREVGSVEAFEEAGLEVVILDAKTTYYADPNLAIPVVTAAVASNPDVDIIAYPGGGIFGNVPTYMDAAGKESGDIIGIGFDTSPQIIDAFEQGFVQITADQQPFLQGYLPVLSLCQQVVLGFGPLTQDTGAGFVTTDNYRVVGELARKGLR